MHLIYLMVINAPRVFYVINAPHVGD